MQQLPIPQLSGFCSTLPTCHPATLPPCSSTAYKNLAFPPGSKPPSLPRLFNRVASGRREVARAAPGRDLAVRSVSPRQLVCLSCLARAWEVSPGARSRAAELGRVCPRASRLSGKDRCTSLLSLRLPPAPRSGGPLAGGHAN